MGRKAEGAASFGGVVALEGEAATVGVAVEARAARINRITDRKWARAHRWLPDALVCSLLGRDEVFCYRFLQQLGREEALVDDEVVVGLHVEPGTESQLGFGS